MFRKKIDEKAIFDKLSSFNAKQIEKESGSIAKELLQGEEVELIGHLVKSEQHMGRSLVIDLEAAAPNNFRQVDHRTIQSIIWRNVKYCLGTKSTLNTLEGWKYSETEKWDGSDRKSTRLNSSHRT